MSLFDNPAELAYHEGVKAHMGGDIIYDNPYNEQLDELLYRAWLEGWEAQDSGKAMTYRALVSR